MPASTTPPRPWIVDFLSTLFLAFCIGVATSVVLGAAVVLMAAEARGAAGARPIDTVPMARSAPAASAGAPQGALLFESGAGGGAVAAPLLATEVAIRVTGAVARARVTQTFLNPYDREYEGVYRLPLPENAEVDRLRVTVGGRVVQSAPQARDRPDVFAARLAPIAPHQDVVVELEYRLRPGPAATVF